MNILITGVAGLIGSNLADWIILNKPEHTIIGIDDLSGGYIENVNDKVIFYNRNVATESVKDIFENHNIDVVYLLNCYAAEGRSNYIRSFIYSNNTVGASNIINECVNYSAKLIFTSSVAVYSGTPPFNEETLPCPIDEYGVSKYCTELSIKIAGETQGLDWVILRPRNVYGEKQSIFDPARNVMGIWMYQILNGQPMTIYGDGNNKRTFTYIKDILEPLYNSMNISKEIINVGSEKAYTIKEANDILCKITPYDKVVHTEARHEVPEAICETQKSKDFLGFEEKHSLHEGLTNMWNWAKNIQMKERRNPPPLEITKNVHSSLINT